MRWPRRRWRSALGVPLGADPAPGWRRREPVAGRLVTHRLRNGATLVDDSYNANPGSLAAAIDTLADSGGEAWLVLGDMRELGADEAALHAEAGARARGRRHRPPVRAGRAERRRRAGVRRRRQRALPSHAALADALRGAAARRRPRAGEGFARQRDGQDRDRAAAAGCRIAGETTDAA